MGAWNTANDDATTPWSPRFVSSPITVDTTYHVVLTLDRSAGRLIGYVDGEDIGQQTGVGRLFSHSNDGAIAAMREHTRTHTGSHTGNGYYFEGIIDELAIYNSVLDAGTIDNRYQMGSVPPDPPPLIEITAPIEGAVLAGVIDIHVEASDPETDSASLIVETSTDGGTTWQPAAWNGVDYTRSFNTTEALDGSHVIVARATDNLPQTSLSAERAVLVDNVDDAPTVAILGPTDGEIVVGDVAIGVQADDDRDIAGTLTAEFSTDDGATWSHLTWDGLHYIATWDSTAVADGPITLTVKATDSFPHSSQATAGVEVFNSNPNLYADAVLADGAAVLYRLGETAGTTAVNAAGGGANGTYLGSPGFGAIPLITTALDPAVTFDGVNDRVDLPNHALINTAPFYEEKTVELWFNAAEVASRQMLYEQGGSTRGISLYLDQGSLYMGAWNTANDDATTPWGPHFISTPVTAGTTYHAVVTLDRGTGLMGGYLNGSLIQEQVGVGRLYGYGSRGAIGSMRDSTRSHSGTHGGNNQWFEGVMDDVAIYNVALDSTAISDHYSVGSIPPNAIPTATVADPPGGAVLAGIVDIHITAADAETDTADLVVETSVDGGATWQPAVWNGADHVYAWATAGAAEGPATVTARATDEAAQTGLADPVDVLIDNVDNPPLVTITQPTDGGIVVGETTIEIDATEDRDAPGALAITVSLDGGAIWHVAPFDGTAHTYSWDTTSVGDGPVTIEAEASDSGPQTSVATPVTVNVFNTNPNVYADTVLADGPSAFWQLSEIAGTTAHDATGGGATGTYTGAPGLGANPLVSIALDAAADFDGINDRVNVGSDPAINSAPFYEAKTIELWFKAADVTSRQILFEQGGMTRGASLYLDQGSLYVGAWNVANDDATTPWGPIFLDVPVSTDTIYHTALTLDAATGTLTGYLDGAVFDQATGAGRLYAHGSRAGIGGAWENTRTHAGSFSGSGLPFDGVIDDVAVYNQLVDGAALSAHHLIGATALDPAPTAAITAPTDGDTLVGPVTIDVTTTDAVTGPPGLVVEVTIDSGVTWLAAAWNGTVHTTPWDTTLTPDGDVTIIARATRSGARTGFSAGIEVEVDNDPTPDHYTLGSGQSAGTIGPIPGLPRDATTQLLEASGLAVHPDNPDVFVSHNDNLGDSRIWFFAAEGPNRRPPLAIYELDGVESGDPESLASDGTNLYLWDNLDYDNTLAVGKISRFTPPMVELGQPFVMAGIPADGFHVRLRKPGGGYMPKNTDVEGLAIHRQTGDLIIVHKDWTQRQNNDTASAPLVWRVPAFTSASPNTTVIGEVIGRLQRRSSPAVGAGQNGGVFLAMDISPDGEVLAIKNHYEIMLYYLGDNNNWAERFGGQYWTPDPSDVFPGDLAESLLFADDMSAAFTLVEGGRFRPNSPPMIRHTLTAD